jgi:hypothetical protein
MGSANLDRFHQVHKLAVLMTALPSYIDSLDDLMFATRHRSRVALVESALELYAREYGYTLPPRLESTSTNCSG